MTLALPMSGFPHPNPLPGGEGEQRCHVHGKHSAFRQPRRDAVYRLFAARAVQARPETHWLAQILTSWSLGQGALPEGLGLRPECQSALMEAYFPGAQLPWAAPSGCTADFSQMLEREDLRRLLLEHASADDALTRVALTDLLVAACLGNDHLWQDLGLWSRTELSALLNHSFPALAARNQRDMKWKKFLYKQLCEAEGIYVCRAPSCAVCCDYAQCFGPEH